MRATFLLIRHAAYDGAGQVLTGRTPGLALSARGVRQALGLPGLIASCGGVDAVYASPRERARQTAIPLVGTGGVATAPEFDELDFGAWTGRRIEDLAGDPRWTAWNERRGEGQTPGGESARDVAARVGRGLARLAAAHGGQRVAVVSHADVIRTALALALGLPLDHLLRFEIDLASVSAVEWGDFGPRVGFVNRTTGSV